MRAQIKITITIVVFLSLCLAYAYFRKPKADLSRELIQFSTSYYRAEGDAVALLTKLSQLEITPATIPLASNLIARLMTIPSGPLLEVAPRGVAWEERKFNSPANIQERMTLWEAISMNDPSLAYILDLYESNFGHTRASVDYFLNYKSNLPYLVLLVSQAAHERGLKLPIIFYEKHLPENSKKVIREVFADERFLNWAKRKRINLKQLSGAANSMIGAYDWLTYPEYASEVGVADFPKTAEANFVIGNGFLIPDLNQLFKLNFTSLDTVSPQMARKWNINFHVVEKWNLPSLRTIEARDQTKTEREDYLSRLEKTSWLKFNAFKDSIPNQYNSYFIASFGYLSSHMTIPGRMALYQPVSMTHLYALYNYLIARRTLELVAAGKKVDLFLYQRGTFGNHQFQTALLSFENKKLKSNKLRTIDLDSPKKEKFLARKVPLAK